MARKFQPQNSELTDAIREGQGKIFAEDLDMLERQQRNLTLYPDRALLMLNIDAGGVQSRRVIERLLTQENNGVAA
jgi:vanillate O-demethylase monooxygenase subunit